ncbi:nuclear transport factor 2 family protein [Nocardia sp. NPDC050175]|uniref:nuclear transport factor 2 family protein n=1 Tax=Nocardia sp. NPDC050175 TaxID=3364317 RepID=UPI00378B5E35
MQREAANTRKSIRRSITVFAAAVLGVGALGLAACGSDDDDKPKEQGTPAVAATWEAAWKDNDPQRLAALFTADGARYTDHAFHRTSTGRDGVAKWAGTTKQFIQGAVLKVDDAFGGSDKVAINWTFSGQLAGAPKPFSVPAVAILTLRGNEIATDDDYYDLADVLRQSGLPADTNFG